MKQNTMKQLGVSGLRRQSGYVYEEFLPELRWPYAAKIYQEMSDNDAVIGSILYLAEMLIRNTTWSVEPASQSNEDVEAAKFVESCMHDMDMSWANTICEILSMLTYGFSFHEEVYKVRRGPEETSQKYKSQYTDCRIGWRRLPVRSQGTLHHWEFSDDGDVEAFVQQAEPDYNLRTIPMTKGLLFRTRMSRDNPEGKSLLRNAYRSWFFKKHFEEIEGIGIERDLAGFPVLTAPQDLDLWNDEDPRMVQLLAKAEDLVSSVRRDSEEGVLLPFGWKLELLSSGSNRQISISDTIERYDNRIAITLLSDIVLIGGSKSGSFALADVKQSMLSAALQAQLQNIADVFNSKAIPDLFALNSFTGLTGFPKLVPGQIQTPSLKEVSLMLRSMGLSIAGDMELQNYLRHILDMPSLDEETFERVYAHQGEAKPGEEDGEGELETGIRADDTVDNLLSQRGDEAYTGGSYNG